MSRTRTVGSQKLIDMIRATGCEYETYVGGDETYGVPTQAYMRKFWKWFRRACWLLGLVWKRGKWECEDYVTLAYACSRLAHRVANAPPHVQAPAIGEWHYVRRVGGGHAVVPAIGEDENGELEVQWWEPQTGERLHLTRGECESCRFSRF